MSSVREVGDGAKLILGLVWATGAVVALIIVWWAVAGLNPLDR